MGLNSLCVVLSQATLFIFNCTIGYINLYSIFKGWKNGPSRWCELRLGVVGRMKWSLFTALLLFLISSSFWSLYFSPRRGCAMVLNFLKCLGILIFGWIHDFFGLICCTFLIICRFLINARFKSIFGPNRFAPLYQEDIHDFHVKDKHCSIKQRNTRANTFVGSY